MIIFGASGDLTKRKLMPALYSLYRDKRLKGEFSVMGVGRTVYSDTDYRAYIYTELEQFVKPEEQDKELMDNFTQHLYYLAIDPAIELAMSAFVSVLRSLPERRNRIICCFIWLHLLLCME